VAPTSGGTVFDRLACFEDLPDPAPATDQLAPVDHAASDVVGMLRLQKRPPMLFPHPELTFVLLQNPQLDERREQYVHGPRVERKLPRHVAGGTVLVGDGIQKTVPERDAEDDGPPPVQFRVVHVRHRTGSIVASGGPVFSRRATRWVRRGRLRSG
jgi:hypothetical protein